MALPNAYAQYKQYNDNRIMSASPAELTLMLYEGAIKFCNMAITAVEHKEVQKAHVNIVKIQKIVQYLRETLDMKYPVAKHFENIYTYLERRLVEANITKDKEILDEINEHLHSVRDTWKEVMRANKEKGGA